MDNNNMKTIKYLKNNNIELDGVPYRPYLIGDLPLNFGCITVPGDPDFKEGIPSWFGHKGFCYVYDSRNKKDRNS